MSGESARVEVKCRGEDVLFWNSVYINGIEICWRQRASSIEDADRLAGDLKLIAEEAFRLGYRHGFGSCQRVIKDAIGVK